MASGETRAGGTGHVDMVLLDEGGSLSVHGWAVSASDEPALQFELEWGGERVAVTAAHAALPSPDVSQTLPHLLTAGRCRFELRAALPAALRAASGSLTPRYPSGSGPRLPCPPIVSEARRREIEYFNQRFHEAAEEVIQFFLDGGVDLTGKHVADIGCGDGVTAVGVAHRVAPARMVGFDIVPTDVAALRTITAAAGVQGPLPPCLEFGTSQPEGLPAADGSFDAAFSWSVFEHVQNPGALAREIRRILRPGGVLMVQIWPLYYSRHGSHLKDWFPDGFVHLLRPASEVEQDMLRRTGDTAGARYMLGEFRTLNRITVDELQDALREGGFTVTRAALTADAIDIPPALAHLPLSRLCTSGVKLLAV